MSCTQDALLAPLHHDRSTTMDVNESVQTPLSEHWPVERVEMTCYNKVVAIVRCKLTLKLKGSLTALKPRALIRSTMLAKSSVKEVLPAQSPSGPVQFAQNC